MIRCGRFTRQLCGRRLVPTLRCPARNRRIALLPSALWFAGAVWGSRLYRVLPSPGPSSLSSYGNGSAATSAVTRTRRFAIETNLILYAASARVLLFRSGS